MSVLAKIKTWQAIALLGGFAEVEEDEVTILVNGAERGDKINLEEARTAYSRSTNAPESSYQQAIVKHKSRQPKPLNAPALVFKLLAV